MCFLLPNRFSSSSSTTSKATQKLRTETVCCVNPIGKTGPVLQRRQRYQQSNWKYLHDDAKSVSCLFLPLTLALSLSFSLIGLFNDTVYITGDVVKKERKKKRSTIHSTHTPSPSHGHILYRFFFFFFPFYLVEKRQNEGGNCVDEMPSGWRGNLPLARFRKTVSYRSSKTAFGPFARVVRLRTDSIYATFGVERIQRWSSATRSISTTNSTTTIEYITRLGYFPMIKTHLRYIDVTRFSLVDNGIKQDFSVSLPFK